MTHNDASALFSETVLTSLFPKERANQFFEALYGDSRDGAYDISLAFSKLENKQLSFEFKLKQRAGKCLACNLTYGLPTVFSRHPVINLNGLQKDINTILNGNASCTRWNIGNTREISNRLHVIPITFHLA
ncbi:MAG: pancreas/duodenum homeobox protein 1 [Pseudomonadota bacterium]